MGKGIIGGFGAPSRAASIDLSATECEEGPAGTGAGLNEHPNPSAVHFEAPRQITHDQNTLPDHMLDGFEPTQDDNTLQNSILADGGFNEFDHAAIGDFHPSGATDVYAMNDDEFEVQPNSPKNPDDLEEGMITDGMADDDFEIQDDDSAGGGFQDDIATVAGHAGPVSFEAEAVYTKPFDVEHSAQMDVNPPLADTAGFVVDETEAGPTHAAATKPSGSTLKLPHPDNPDLNAMQSIAHWAAGVLSGFSNFVSDPGVTLRAAMDKIHMWFGGSSDQKEVMALTKGSKQHGVQFSDQDIAKLQHLKPGEATQLLRCQRNRFFGPKVSQDEARAIQAKSIRTFLDTGSMEAVKAWQDEAIAGALDGRHSQRHKAQLWEAITNTHSILPGELDDEDLSTQTPAAAPNQPDNITNDLLHISTLSTAPRQGEDGEPAAVNMRRKTSHDHIAQDVDAVDVAKRKSKPSRLNVYDKMARQIKNAGRGNPDLNKLRIMLRNASIEHWKMGQIAPDVATGINSEIDRCLTEHGQQNVQLFAVLTTAKHFIAERQKASDATGDVSSEPQKRPVFRDQQRLQETADALASADRLNIETRALRVLVLKHALHTHPLEKMSPEAAREISNAIAKARVEARSERGSRQLRSTLNQLKSLIDARSKD